VTEEIVNGISLALTEAFPGCPVYGDTRVSQGLETPSFFVGLGEHHAAPLPSGLLGVRQAVDVVYFPERREDYREMWGVGPRVLALLGELPLPDGSMLRGTNLRCDIVDGLMHMRAVYRLRLKGVEEDWVGGIMEEIEIWTGIG